MKDDWLSGKFQIEWFAPELDASHCVHSLLEVATCQACVDACPRDAWELSDESLQINVAECDVCGLCEPVCPEQAIQFEHTFKPRILTDQRIVFVACEKVDFASSDESIPCLHSISERTLLEMRKKGDYQLVVAQGDCSRCNRGRAVPLSARLDNVNRWLVSQGLTKIEAARCRDDDQWQRFLEKAHVADESELVGRRGFFRQMLGEVAKAASEDIRNRGSTPTGSIISAHKHGHITPASPAINADRCTACDACVRVCPHDVLRLDGQNMQYKINADLCTGCGLCVDVCEDKAVHLIFWETPTQTGVPLLAGKCKSCGVDFRVVYRETVQPPEKCRICQKTDFHSQLFQVYD